MLTGSEQVFITRTSSADSFFMASLEHVAPHWNNFLAFVQTLWELSPWTLQQKWRAKICKTPTGSTWMACDGVREEHGGHKSKWDVSTDVINRRTTHTLSADYLHTNNGIKGHCVLCHPGIISLQLLIVVRDAVIMSRSSFAAHGLIIVGCNGTSVRDVCCPLATFVYGYHCPVWTIALKPTWPKREDAMAFFCTEDTNAITAASLLIELIPMWSRCPFLRRVLVWCCHLWSESRVIILRLACAVILSKPRQPQCLPYFLWSPQSIHLESSSSSAVDATCKFLAENKSCIPQITLHSIVIHFWDPSICEGATVPSVPEQRPSAH